MVLITGTTMFHQVRRKLKYMYSFSSTRGISRSSHSAGSSATSASAVFIEDEYKDTTDNAIENSESSVYQLSNAFELENGQKIQGVEVKYSTYGTLNPTRDNVIVLCHALSGHADVHQWWDEFVKSYWTEKYFIICTNILGSCYGTTGPTSIDPVTKERYGPNFPNVTIRDAVNLQKRLLDEAFAVRQVKSVIGGSLGGMQTLEWAFFGPEYVQSFIPIACGSHHTAWQIGISELQRQAIYMDPMFKKGLYDSTNPPTKGLSLARQIAMVSYRTYEAYFEKYGREMDEKKDRFQVQSYLAYQGKKFLTRFDVNSYLALTKMMDTHDVGIKRGGLQNALSTLTQPSLVIGVDSDVLYPIAEQIDLANSLPNASLKVISSSHGHDGFLLEQKQIASFAADFLKKNNL